MLDDAVESILRGRDVPGEIVIVDQSENSHPTLRHGTSTRGSEIRYIWTNSRGLSRSINEGIATAQHDVLVFAHDDVLAAPEWFGTIVRALCEAGQRTLVTGQVKPADDRAGSFQLSVNVSECPAVYAGRVGTDPLFPMNMAMYRSAVAEIGTFDERLGPGTAYPAAEDNDFGLRALEKGFAIKYVPEATLYHRAWRSRAEWFPLHWSYGVGQGAYYAKHIALLDRYMLQRLCRNLVGNACWFIFRACRGERDKAQAHAGYMLGMIYGLLRWLLTQGKTF